MDEFMSNVPKSNQDEEQRKVWEFFLKYRLNFFKFKKKDV